MWRYRRVDVDVDVASERKNGRNDNLRLRGRAYKTHRWTLIERNW